MVYFQCHLFHARNCYLVRIFCQENFDLVLEQNNLEAASMALASYLESYLMALHCYGDISKAERILGAHFGAKPTEAKIVRPMVPGRAGLNIATPVSHRSHLNVLLVHILVDK